MSVSRRWFVQGLSVTGLALLAGCGRLPGQAPTPARMYRIAMLHPGSSSRHASADEGLQQSLRELGYVQGQNIIVEVRYVDGQLARLPELVGEVLSLPVDVIVANSAVVARAAQQATTTIPIVVVTGDPVRAGFVASYGHPGGNITGLSNIAPELASKRLELLKEAVPAITHVAVIWNQADQTMGVEFGETLLAAEVLGVQLQSLPVREQSDLARAYEAAAHGGADAIVLIADQFIAGNRPQLVGLSAQSRMP